MTDPILERIEAKLNALGKAVGGPALKDAWDEAEQDLRPTRRTFRKARCGCWKGSPHRKGCSKHVPHDPLGSVA